MSEQGSEEKNTSATKSGLGVLCSEAQADGVPCHELDFDCENCEKADLKPATKKPPDAETT